MTIKMGAVEYVNSTAPILEFYPTIFLTHVLRFSNIKPMMALTKSAETQHAYMGRIGMDVKCASEYAIGILTTHTKTLSNRKVINVFPPERIVKYEAWLNALSGITLAEIQSNPVAMRRTSASVL